MMRDVASAWRRHLFLRRVGLPAVVPFIPQAATLALVALVASMLFAERADGLYLAALFLALLVSGALFFTLVVTMISDSNSDILE